MPVIWDPAAGKLHDVSGPVTGLPELRAALLQLGDRAMAETATLLEREAEEILAEAVGLTPVDLGILAGSGFVEPARVTSDEVTVRMGFGGLASDYAIVQHERLDFYHDDGQAKFLETPVARRFRDFPKRLADKLRAVIQRIAGK